MKKKILTLMILLLTITMVNVYAEPKVILNSDASIEADEETLGWPKTITHGDYSIEIQGVSLNIYEFIYTTSEDGTSTTTKPKNEENFIKEIPDKTINLNAADYTINPSFIEDKFGSINALYVDLGLEITKEQIETLLSSEKASVTKDNQYLAEVSVTYKVNSYPTKYTNAFRTNYLRSFIMLFSDISVTPKIDLTQPTSQVVNGALILINEETDQPEVRFETKMDDENGVGLFAINYLQFSNSDDPNSSDDTFALILHNMDNIEYLIENLQYIESNASDYIDGDETLKDQEVQVPNTGKMVSIYLYLLSVSIILIGIGIIFYTINKKAIKSE